MKLPQILSILLISVGIFATALSAQPLRGTTVDTPANDCVPVAFALLSELAGRPIPHVQWYNWIMPSGKPSPLSVDLIHWNRHNIDMPLVPVLSRIPPSREYLPSFTSLDLDLTWDEPLFWVGDAPAAFVEPGTTSPYLHAAVMYMRPDCIILVSPLNGSLKTFLVERISYVEWILRTTAVYRLRPLMPVVWRPAF